MPKRAARGDVNQTAYAIVPQVTGQAAPTSTAKPKKFPAVVALGRVRGWRDGKERAASL